MAQPNVPKFTYDSGPTTLTLTWAAREWEYVHSGIGGTRWAAAAGYAASYVIRRDRDLALTLRVLESERASVETFIEFVQTVDNADPFTFWPDKETAGTSYSVLLVQPEMGSEWQWARDPEYPHLFTVRLVLRKLDGTRWTDTYHT